jgi:hypothetical protein
MDGFCVAGSVICGNILCSMTVVQKTTIRNLINITQTSQQLNTNHPTTPNRLLTCQRVKNSAVLRPYSGNFGTAGVNAPQGC